MKNRIIDVLSLIHNEVSSVRNYDDSIFGELGTALFRLEYNKYFNDDSISIVVDQFSDVINRNLTNTVNSFATGILSYGVIYDVLERQSFLERSLEFEHAISDAAKSSGRYLIENDNLDFLYGATGVAYFLLHQLTRKYDHSFVSEYVAYLDAKKIKLNGGLCWEDSNLKKKEGGMPINLGLAHGNPAILKVLIKIFETTDIDKEKVLSLITGSAYFLLNSRKKDTSRSFYNTSLVDGCVTDEHSRLAWCYGDISLAVILYQAGLVIKREEILNAAVDILLKSTSRISRSETGLVDGGLCHGTAGVAHIFYKAWKYCKHPELKRVSDYWIEKTLSFCTDVYKTDQYLKYNPEEKAYTKSTALIDGSSGVGLVLLSYLTGECNWDYCLMLND